MAGKAKWIEKRSARGRPVKLVFLQCKITNCSNNHTISQDICTLFARYSVSLDNNSRYFPSCTISKVWPGSVVYSGQLFRMAKFPFTF